MSRRHHFQNLQVCTCCGHEFPKNERAKQSSCPLCGVTQHFDNTPTRFERRKHQIQSFEAPAPILDPILEAPLTQEEQQIEDDFSFEAPAEPRDPFKKPRHILHTCLCGYVAAGRSTFNIHRCECLLWRTRPHKWAVFRYRYKQTVEAHKRILCPECHYSVYSHCVTCSHYVFHIDLLRRLKRWNLSPRVFQEVVRALAKRYVT